jgi:hypothetical protein
MLCKDEGSFWLTDAELANSPSRGDGISEALEKQLRSYGAGLVQEAVILLRLPQAVAATGMVLLQRFYCKHSFKKHNVEVRAPVAWPFPVPAGVAACQAAHAALTAMIWAGLNSHA